MIVVILICEIRMAPYSDLHREGNLLIFYSNRGNRIYLITSAASEGTFGARDVVPPATSRSFFSHLSCLISIQITLHYQ